MAGASPEHLDEESRHIKIYSIFSLGSEKALVSKMRNVVKEKKRLKKILCSLLIVAASFCNPIPSPGGEGTAKGWASFKQSLVLLLPSLC